MNTPQKTPLVYWLEEPSENLSLENFGKIDVPPGAPPLAPGRNWLWTACKYEAASDAPVAPTKVLKEWTASDEGGWDPMLYG